MEVISPKIKYVKIIDHFLKGGQGSVMAGDIQGGAKVTQVSNAATRNTLGIRQTYLSCINEYYGPRQANVTS